MLVVTPEKRPSCGRSISSYYLYELAEFFKLLLLFMGIIINSIDNFFDLIFDYSLDIFFDLTFDYNIFR